LLQGKRKKPSCRAGKGVQQGRETRKKGKGSRLACLSGLIRPCDLTAEPRCFRKLLVNCWGGRGSLAPHLPHICPSSSWASQHCLFWILPTSHLVSDLPSPSTKRRVQKRIQPVSGPVFLESFAVTEIIQGSQYQHGFQRDEGLDWSEVAPLCPGGSGVN
jgi:hypothetical protein